MEKKLSISADNLKQILQLRELVSKQLKQNLQKYNKLKQSGLCSSFVLYIPTVSQNNDLKANQINTQKLYLEGIMNKLMKDQELLSKQQRKHIYEIEEENQQKRQMNQSVFKSYNYLRSAWTQFDKTNPEQVDDHLDRLNKTVAVLKGNLQRSYTSAKSKKSNFYTMDELLHCQQYQSLLRNYEQSRMELEDTVQRYQALLGEIEQKNKRLEQQNRVMKKQMQEFKSRQILQTATFINRPNIMSPAIDIKPLFQNPYFQIRVMKIPSDDSSYYSKCLDDLKEFAKNYSTSEESIKEQRALAIKNLHHFARSQDFTKVKFQKIKPLPENQKIGPERFAKVEIVRSQLSKLT